MNNVPSQVEVYRVLLTAENADHLTADTSKTSSVPGNSPKPNFTSKRPKSQPNGTQVSGLARARSSRSQNEPQGVSTKEHDQTKADCEPWMSGYKEVQRDHKKLEENFKSSNNALSLATKDLRDHEKSSNGLSHKSDGSFRDSAVKFDSTDEPEWTEEETDPSKRLYGLGLPLLKSNSRALAEQTARWPPPIGKDCDMANYFMCCDQTLRKQMSKDCDVMSKARDYAARLGNILLPQLNHLGVTGPRDPSYQGFHKVASAHLTSSMMAALTVKTLMERMPVEEQFKWYATGTTCNCNEIETQEGSVSPHDAGPEPIVGRAVTPLFKYRSTAGPSAEGMTIPAMGVWLMRKD